MYMNEEKFIKYCVPEEFKNATLDNLNKVPKKFIEFGREWALKPSSIFLTGPYGTGKTAFSFALLREMFRKCKYDIWPRYYTSPNLDSQLLKASKHEDGDEYLISKMAQEDLLFIDDIGRETRSDRLRRQYFEILNHRHVHRKPTILTSNLPLEKLGEIIDGAIASRIQSWHILEFNGPDLRKG